MNVCVCDCVGGSLDLDLDLGLDWWGEGRGDSLNPAPVSSMSPILLLCNNRDAVDRGWNPD